MVFMRTFWKREEDGLYYAWMELPEGNEVLLKQVENVELWLPGGGNISSEQNKIEPWRENVNESLYDKEALQKTYNSLSETARGGRADEAK